MGNEQQRQEQQESTHQQRLLQHKEPLHTLPEQVFMVGLGLCLYQYMKTDHALLSSPEGEAQPGSTYPCLPSLALTVGTSHASPEGQVDSALCCPLTSADYICLVMRAGVPQVCLWGVSSM